MKKSDKTSTAGLAGKSLRATLDPETQALFDEWVTTLSPEDRVRVLYYLEGIVNHESDKVWAEVLRRHQGAAPELTDLGVAECTGCGYKLTDEEIAGYVEVARSGSYGRPAGSKETTRTIPLPSGGSVTLRVPTAQDTDTLSGGFLSEPGVFRAKIDERLAEKDRETTELKTKGFSRLFKLPSGEKIVLSGLSINKLAELHAMKMDALSWKNEQLKKLGLGDHATPQDAVDASAMLSFLSTQPGRSLRFPVSFTDSKGVTVTSPEPGVLQPDIVVNDSPAFRRELFPLGFTPMFNFCSPQREQMFAESEAGKLLAKAINGGNPIHALDIETINLDGKGGRDARRMVTRQDLLNHLFDPSTKITGTPTLFNPTPAFASAVQLAWLSRPGTPFQKAFKGFNKKAKLFAGKVKK